MGSGYGICEIVELKEELSCSSYSKRFQHTRVFQRERKPPVQKHVHSKALEDDINKLFEAIKSKSSLNCLSPSNETGGDLSRKNALKKPMRMSTLSPSGIGFSEPVSLKQALRGLCISQASEMAAMKRLAKPPGSPSVLRSVVAKSSEPGPSHAEGEKGNFEISPETEESTTAPLGKMSQSLQEHKVKSCNNSTHSSPRFDPRTTMMGMGSKPMQNEIMSASVELGVQLPKIGPVQEQGNILMFSPSCSTSTNDATKSVQNVSVSSKHTSNHVKNLPMPTKSGNKSGQKLRRKGRLPSPSSSSTSVNSSNLGKTVKNPPRAVKAVVIRNKSSTKKKKPKQGSASTPGTSSACSEQYAALDPVPSLLTCQKCQCTLKEKRKESEAPHFTGIGAEVNLNNGSDGVMSQGPAPVIPAIVYHNKNLKCGDSKGELTQSSKSSVGEYSSSTSMSEESNLSRCSVGNRPHMSKDMRWRAIHHVMKQNGFIGLRHFNLLKKLGCGDIGTVYLAELVGTNCPFAIKVMDNEFLERRNKMPRAQTEREILRILDHPFLPTLYAHFVSENLSCLVMEYCPGGDLHVLRQKQPGRFFQEQAARFYVAEVLLALEYLHMLGIIYRDLKPENILVREDGHIMLTDFDLSLRCSVSPTLVSPSLGIEPPRMSGPCVGSNCIDPFCMKPTCQVSCFSPRILPGAKAKKAKASDLATRIRSLPQLVAEPTDARSNSFVGTHEYLAPEIIKGDGHGNAVDWWTFGIFLYELLYGKTPFKGLGNDETLANVVLQSLKFPDTPLVSLQARDLIKGLLVKEPENRLGSRRGAAEIKQHPFFDGLNWALIRCAIPPELPDPCDVGVQKVVAVEKGKKYLNYGGSIGGQLEFELF